MTSQMARFASLDDIDLDSAQVDLRFEFGPGRPAATKLEYRASFTGETTPEKIDRMMSLVEKGCHTTNTIHTEVPVAGDLILNGEELERSFGSDLREAPESFSTDLA